MKDTSYARSKLSLFALFMVLGAKLDVALAQAEKPQPVVQAGHAEIVWALAISPNSSMVASGGLDGTIKIWNISEGRLWRTLDGPFAAIDALAFSPDSRLLASGTEDHVTLFDVGTGSEVRRIKACDPVLKERQALSDFSVANPSAVAAVAFSPAGRLLVSACDGDESIKVWDLSMDQPPRQIRLPSDPTESTRQEFGMTIAKESAGVTSLAFDSSGRWLASGSNDNAVRVWEFSTARQVLVLRGHATYVISLSFSADGRFLASSDPEISRLWDVASGTSVTVASGGWSAFDSRGRWLLAQEDGSVTARVIATRKSEQIPGQLRRDRPMVLSPTRRWLISGGKTLVVTDLVTGDERRLPDFSVARRRLTPSRDGNWLALQPYFSNDTQSRLKLWNVGTGQFRTLSGPGASHAAFSADARFLAASAEDKVIRLWDVATAREMKSFTFASSTSSVSLSGDGRWLAAAGYDGTIAAWEVDSGQLLRSFSVDRYATTVAFSPDSRWLAYSTPDGIIMADAQTGQQVRTIKGFAPMLFSPDSRMLALSDGPGVIKLWDVLTGREVRTLKRGFADMWSAAFSVDSRWLASRDRDQNVVLWDLQTGASAGVFTGYSVGFAAGENVLWITGKDGITRFRNPEKGTLIASLVITDDTDEWAIVMADGRFDGTPVGIQKLVAFRRDNHILPSDQFMRLRTPGLLAELLLRAPVR